MYGRFFIALLVLMLAKFFFGPVGMLVSYVLVIIDCAMLTRKIQDGKQIWPPKNVWLTVIILIVILGSLVLSFIPKYMFAFSDDSCDVLYPQIFSFDLAKSLQSISENSQCKQMVHQGKTFFGFMLEKPPKDAACESETYDLKDICYLKKAIDTKNYKFCHNTYIPSSCIENVAIALRDSAVCSFTDSESYCARKVAACVTSDEDCKLDSYETCDAFTYDEKKKNDCIHKYNLTSQ
jgi:hypothetical protein